MRVLWQCEIDPYCRRVLAKHWPHVRCFEDVRDMRAGSGVEPVDVLCGGFPCQDLSVAGRGEGLAGARSSLWSEFARLIGELGPRWVVVENVPALRTRGLGRILGEMAALGYDAEWDGLPAVAFGAPHRRDRIWIVAYPGGEGRREDAESTHGYESEDAWRAAQDDHLVGSVGEDTLAYSECSRLEGQRSEAGETQVAESRDGRASYSDTDSAGRGEQRVAQPAGIEGASGSVADRLCEDGHLNYAQIARWWATESDVGRVADELSPWMDGGGLDVERSCYQEAWWDVEPPVERVAIDVPNRVDRLRSLGNALVPQIAEWIGRRIVSYEERCST
jgi:DNA (cytosine-5)-methyltransferase 1